MLRKYFGIILNADENLGPNVDAVKQYNENKTKIDVETVAISLFLVNKVNLNNCKNNVKLIIKNIRILLEKNIKGRQEEKKMVFFLQIQIK